MSSAYPGFGITGAQLLAGTTGTGGSGPGVLYPCVDSGDEAKEFSFRVLSAPASGAFTINEDGSGSLIGASDGDRSWSMQLVVDGVNVGSPITQTVTVGQTAATMTSAAGLAAVSFGGTAIKSAAVAAAGQAVIAFSGSSSAAGTMTPAAGSSTVAFFSGSGGSMTPAVGQSTVAFSGSSTTTATMTPAVGQGTTALVGASRAAADMSPAAGASIAAFIGQAIEDGDGGTARPEDVWNYVLPNGLSASQTLVQMHAMLADLYKIHGLAAGSPLVVTQSARTAGSIEQSITEVGTEVTISRVN